MNSLISFYRNNKDTKNSTVLQISYLPNLIKQSTEEIKSTIQQIRLSTDKDNQKQLKGTLPMFTCCGIFSYRSLSGLKDYSNFVCLDFDGITDQQRLTELKKQFCSLPFVYMVFLSPRCGLKVIVNHTNHNPQYHKNLFAQLHNIPEFNIPEFDESCSDVTRTTYLSYDPEVYVNPDVIPYQFTYNPSFDKKSVTTNAILPHSQSHKTVISPYQTQPFSDGYNDTQVINYMNSHFWKKHPEDYQEGNRKTSLMKKAGRLCVFGVSYEAAMKELKYRYIYKGLSDSEVEEAVDYCYKNNDFGSKRQEFLDMKNYSTGNDFNNIFNSIINRRDEDI